MVARSDITYGPYQADWESGAALPRTCAQQKKSAVNYPNIEEWVAQKSAETICFSAILAYGGGAVAKPRLLAMVKAAPSPARKRS